MKNKQPKIFVIVVTYKGMRWYDKCFTSLRESTIPVQTIVVDNTPGEEDANYIRAHFPEIILLKPEQNLGFGKGNNLAMKYAREHDADYVFLLNQDTWLIDNEMFAKLVTISEKHPDYGILSPMHLKADEKSLFMMWEYQNNTTSSQFINDYYRGAIQEIYSTNYVNAAAWLLPRKTLEIVGGFDPIYQQYGEDDNYLCRVRYHKLKIGICPQIKLVHDHQVTINPFSKNKDQYYHLQQILVKLTDVNFEVSNCRYIFYLIRKVLICAIIFDFGRMREWLCDLRFVVLNLSAINSSLSQNKKEEASWL